MGTLVIDEEFPRGADQLLGKANRGRVRSPLSSGTQSFERCAILTSCAPNKRVLAQLAKERFSFMSEVAETQPKPDDDEAEQEQKPKRIATIMAHPDDAEFSCGASLAKWAAEGHHVTIVLVTNGDKGSDDRSISSPDLAAIREREQAEAARILGVKELVFMRNEDCMVVPTLELRRELVRVIRRIKPDVVVCSDPTVFFGGSNYINHPDHRAVATAVLEAIFPAARNHRIFPELLDEGLEPHRADEVLIAAWDGGDFVVDVSDFMDKKIEALRAHKSQMGEWDPNDEIRKWSEERGKKQEPPMAYAEAFRKFVLD
jgi:LmbE family N-acetylglucosaminyl deacetylase